jgi:protease-4
MQNAIDCAVRMAKLKEYRIKQYPEKKSFLQNLMSGYKTEVKSKVMKEEIGVEQYEMMQRLKNIRSMLSIPQARLPFDVEIR